MRTVIKPQRNYAAVLGAARQYRIKHQLKIERLEAAIKELMDLGVKGEWTPADLDRIASLDYIVRTNR